VKDLQCGRPARAFGISAVALGVAGLMSTTAAAPAWAQSPAESDRTELAQSSLRRFDIVPQPLADALVQFGYQSGLQVAVDGAVVASLRTQGISGSFTVADALDRLLSSTGLVFQFTNANSVQVRQADSGAGSGAMKLDPVQVQGYAAPAQAMIGNVPPPFAGGQVATGGQLGMLGNRDFMDTPFNQTSYTAKLMANQQARSLADVVANDPSVRNQWSSVSYTAPLLVRGFPVSNQDIAFGGLFGIAPAATVTPEYLERVEVLKGPSALLSGMAPFGSIGGTINLVPKRAPDQEINQLTATYASDAQFGGHADISRRFGPDKAYGVRFNGVYRNGDTSVDRETQEMAAAVFAADFRGERFRASLDFGYQKQRFNSPLRPTYVAAGVPVPVTPGGRSNWFQPWSYAESDDLFGAVRLEYDLAPEWTVFGSVGSRRYRLDSLMGFGTVTSASGAMTDAPFNFQGWANTNTEEIGIRGKAETGAFKHSLSLAGTRLDLVTGNVFPVVTSVASNIYSPTFVNKPNVAAISPPKTGTTTLSSVALADIVSAAEERIQLILGARYQRVQIGNFSSATGALTSSYDSDAISPAVGFVVRPWKEFSLYGNYIQGLQQGPTAPVGTTNAGQMFPPIKSRQFEVGTKLDFGKFATTLSAFSIEQPSGATDPTTLAYSLIGLQRNQGLEWNIFGEPIPGFRPLGGITLLNGVLVNTNSPLTNGKKATGVPDVQLNLGAEWDASFLRGLTFSGRIIYTSMQYLNAANTQSIPAWTRFDAGVRYTFERADGKPITARFNVENLFDANYWAAASATYGLSNAAPRTFLLSLTADF
jgi:iron complex outermembrane receptor protein